MMNRALRSLCAMAAMLAANEVCGFVTPAGVSSLAGRTPVARVATSPSRSSRRWEKQQQMDAGNVDASGAGDKGTGTFQSWVQKAAGRLGRGPFSRAAKSKDGVEDLLNSEAFLKKKVDMLKKQITVTEGEIKDAELEAQAAWDEWGPQVTRLEKEFALLKSRGGEAVTKAYDKGKAEAFNEILVVTDTFERAAAAISAETDGEKAVVAYYKDVYATMIGCLEGLGLKEVEMIGAQFDYNIHNAIMHESTNEFSEDTVCQVFQKGYRFGETLVRPAMVAVASPA